jgi:putative proteasome-type protease
MRCDVGQQQQIQRRRVTEIPIAGNTGIHCSWFESDEQRGFAITYCIGIMLDAGLVLASDSRTHAGVDNFASFCKMTLFDRAGDRVFILLSSGNLAGTQAVIGLLKQRNAKEGVPNLWGTESMFDAAMLVSDAMRDVDRRDGQRLAGSGGGFNASFILGG